MRWILVRFMMCVMAFGVLFYGSDARAQILPRGHFRVAVDSGQDNYRVRVGRGVEVKRLLRFVNRRIQAGDQPVTEDDFIAENLSQRNLLFVCGHVAHRRRTVSRDVNHWATCPDAPHRLKLIANYQDYWIPRRHRAGEIEALSTEVQTALANVSSVPIRWEQAMSWVGRWFQAFSPVYQPGYLALANTRVHVLRAMEEVEQPSSRPPPRTIVLPHATRVASSPVSRQPEDLSWSSRQLIASFLFGIFSFIVGLQGRRFYDRRSYARAASIEELYGKIVDAYHEHFIRPASQVTTLEDVIAPMRWTRAVLSTYAKYRAFLETPDATEVSEGVRIQRVQAVLEQYAALRALAHARGVVLSPESLAKLLAHWECEVYDPNVLDMREIENTKFRKTTERLCGEGRSEPADLDAYANAQAVAFNHPLGHRTPLVNPIAFPAHLHLQTRIEELEGALERQTASIPPGTRAAAVFASQILPALKMIASHIEAHGKDLIASARQMHLEDPGGAFGPFVANVQDYVQAVGDLLVLDDRVLGLLEDAELAALRDFEHRAKVRTPSALNELISAILAHRGYTPQPGPIPYRDSVDDLSGQFWPQEPLESEAVVRAPFSDDSIKPPGTETLPPPPPSRPSNPSGQNT